MHQSDSLFVNVSEVSCMTTLGRGFHGYRELTSIPVFCFCGLNWLQTCRYFELIWERRHHHSPFDVQNDRMHITSFSVFPSHYTHRITCVLYNRAQIMSLYKLPIQTVFSNLSVLKKRRLGITYLNEFSVFPLPMARRYMNCWLIEIMSN